VPDAGSEPIGSPSPRPRGTSRLAELTARLRDFGRRRRTLIAVVGSLATAAVLAFLLAGRRHEFAAALGVVPSQKALTPRSISLRPPVFRRALRDRGASDHNCSCSSRA
jgi:hypothetical protein